VHNEIRSEALDRTGGTDSNILNSTHSHAGIEDQGPAHFHIVLEFECGNRVTTCSSQVHRLDRDALSNTERDLITELLDYAVYFDVTRDVSQASWTEYPGDLTDGRNTADLAGANGINSTGRRGGSLEGRAHHLVKCSLQRIRRDEPR
jgi:hypothetical protein